MCCQGIISVKGIQNTSYFVFKRKHNDLSVNTLTNNKTVDGKDCRRIGV